MSDEVTMRQEMAKKLATDELGATPSSFENPLTVLASPAWRGVEGDIWRATSQDRSIILKHYHADTAFYVDAGPAIQATEEAGRLGVGPTVLGSAPKDGLIVLSDLADPWVAGGLHHAIDPELRAAVIEQKKMFQTSAKLMKSTSIFDEIEALYDITQTGSIITHNDIVPFMAFVRDAALKLNALGKDEAPCHRDGNTANLMIHPDKTVKLIDFDLAANCDPFEDIGAYLVEFFETDADARNGFEEWHGSFNEGLFQRAMIYGLADDLRWGLIGSIMGAQSERSSLEFTKYAAWRFIRLQAQAKRSDANDRIRLAA
jgi:hypothetical protein